MREGREDGGAAHNTVRLFVTADLGAGAVIGLSREQAHYLQHVMRRSIGDPLLLFNGRDGEWAARIDGIGRGWCSAAIVSQTRPQPVEPDLWLVFAPIKRARVDFLAEKATELGVSALWPMMTRRTIVARVNAERLLANAIEAAEQSERLSVPQILAPASLSEIVQEWPRERRVILCDETGRGTPIAEALKMLAGDGAHAIVTGPEGGFEPGELDAFADLPFVSRVSLGPRVLRADTAALAALACFQALIGDGRAKCCRRAAP
jgi:16S rRNA (uracil1498-N3)-methyltransferase